MAGQVILTAVSCKSSTTSKHTAFYSAHSHLTADSISFHTAAGENDSAIDVSRIGRDHIVGVIGVSQLGGDHSAVGVIGVSQLGGDKTVDYSAIDVSRIGRGEMSSEEERRRHEDHQLSEALAAQYILTAEAAGPRTPTGHRSRETDGSRGVGGDLQTTTTGSDDMMPGMARGLGRDYESGESRGREQGPEYTGYGVPSYSQESLSEKSGRALSERLRDEEVEDDAFEAQHFLSTRRRYPAPKYAVQMDAAIPAGAVLFACGFLVLPLWWVGAVFPRHSEEPVVRTWRKYNALMSLLSIPLLALFLALGGWHATHDA
ncbi:hypothetical protein GGF46_003570 [Coemansia sp. RSA 552]|nr:hypothetical protein GGF46_003570 [Coemansia sp. RSA 552]